MQTKTKKLSGPIHHKHTKPYLQAYFPYLPLLILVIGIFASLTASFKPSSNTVLGASSSITTVSLLQDTNNERSKNHEPALIANDAVARAAQNKANDMVARNYWSHSTPDGRTPWSFLDASGYTYQFAGENLAYGFADSQDAVAGWMNSASHRANLLSNKYVTAGFGVATSNDYQNKGPSTVVVALYAAPVGSSGVLSVATLADESSTNISTLQTLTRGSMPWIGTAALLLSIILIVLLIARRNKKLLKKLKRGEKAILAHPLVDVTVIAFVVLLAVLSRTAGIIH